MREKGRMLLTEKEVEGATEWLGRAKEREEERENQR